ncbi:MAG: hypothetical protein JWO51_3341 [Rhodospirillales bacterium]|nr:hypothetical protein [Rhodospirillales bacterium]
MELYFLIIDVHGLRRPDGAMGKNVVDAALAAFEPRIADLVTQVLAPRPDVGPVKALGRGRWRASFFVEAVQLTGAEDDPVVSLTAALRQLVNEVAIETFGPSTAAVAELTITAVDASASGDVEDRLATAALMAVDTSARAAIQDLLVRGGLRTVLQPIVSLADGRAVGLEALSRGPAGSALERADRLFEAAARGGLTLALELACAYQAVAYLDRVPAPLWLSINASCRTLAQLCSPQGVGRFARPRLVMELTEHLPLGEASELRPVLASLRRGGTLIALDDTGCGYADLEAAASLRPEIVKLCITVTNRIEHNSLVLDDIAETVRRLHRQEHLVLAEGVETAAQADLLRALGVDLAQGWFYGRPFAADQVADWARSISADLTGAASSAA